MTPDRMAHLVLGWVRFYSRHVPPLVAERRAGEIEADVHDHVASGRAAGVPDGRIAAAIASRMIRGIVADLAWRRRHVRIADSTATQGKIMTRAVYLSARRIAVAVVAVLSIPFVATLSSDEVDWGVGDFVLAAVLLAVVGVGVDLAVRRRGNLVAAGAIATIGTFAAVVGNADDAPGLVLLGILLIGSAAALALRRLPASR
jgi:hypothetical protein